MGKRALIVVDMQNDFLTGTLALSGCPAKQVLIYYSKKLFKTALNCLYITVKLNCVVFSYPL